MPTLREAPAPCAIQDIGLVHTAMHAGLPHTVLGAILHVRSNLGFLFCSGGLKHVFLTLDWLIASCFPSAFGYRVRAPMTQEGVARLNRTVLVRGGAACIPFVTELELLPR